MYYHGHSLLSRLNQEQYETIVMLTKSHVKLKKIFGPSQVGGRDYQNFYITCLQ